MMAAAQEDAVRHYRALKASRRAAGEADCFACATASIIDIQISSEFRH
jgi:hypothetical protein